MNRRELVARALEDADPDGPMRYDGEPDFLELEQDDLEKYFKYFGMSDAAIAAMGLPSREQIEAALDAVFLLKLNWLGARLEHGDSGPNTDPAFEKYAAARQRLIALIPMKEADDV